MRRFGAAYRVALVMLAAALALAATCGDRPRPGADDSVSPDLVISESRERFREALSYKLRYSAESGPERIEGEGAFVPPDVLYGRATLTFDGVVVTDALYLPPDLYLFEDESIGWVAISPWYQGQREEERTDLVFDRPIVGYDDLALHMRDIERESDDKVEGVTVERYSAVIDGAQLQVFATVGDPVVADVDLWLQPGTRLPVRVRVIVGGGHGYQFTLEYSNYDQAIDRPEPPSESRPVRDVQLPFAPCTGDGFDACLLPQGGITSTGACQGEGRRVCLAPLGNVSPDLVQHLVAHYREQYGLDVIVLPAAAIPVEHADPVRKQVNAYGLVNHMWSLYPAARDDPFAVLIGVTAVDVYDPSSHYRYLLGIKGDPANAYGIVSTFRMDPVTYGEPRDDTAMFSRARKMVTKYIGWLYYWMPVSEDPTSPMYDSIGGPADLDVMTEPLDTSWE